MRQPCQYGFRCPYLYHDEECNEVCTYPFIRPTEDDGGFVAPEDQICKLMECDSDMEKILCGYEHSNKIQYQIAMEWEILEKENTELVMKLHKEIFGDDVDGGIE